MSYKALTKENCKDFKNFKYSEFKCKCNEYCNGYPVAFSYDLASNLQKVRDHFKKAVIITSPLRCVKWNNKVGGEKNSKHTKGWACDFYVKDTKYNEVASYVKKLPYFRYCYNISGSVIHYDIIPPEEVKPKVKYHIVKSGETLTSIAKKYNTTWQKIYEKNKSVIGSNPNLIKPGMKLKI